MDNTGKSNRPSAGGQTSGINTGEQESVRNELKRFVWVVETPGGGACVALMRASSPPDLTEPNARTAMFELTDAVLQQMSATNSEGQESDRNELKRFVKVVDLPGGGSCVWLVRAHSARELLESTKCLLPAQRAVIFELRANVLEPIQSWAGNPDCKDRLLIIPE